MKPTLTYDDVWEIEKIIETHTTIELKENIPSQYKINERLLKKLRKMRIVGDEI